MGGIYIFPGSNCSALYKMEMTIGERVIMAVIQEKKIARQTYGQAKEEGKTTSHLKEMAPNVFKMNVANIMPGDKINIILMYTEVLVPSEGVYEFVYPSVVGPRYVSPDQAELEENRTVFYL